MEEQINRAEFDRFVATVGKALLDCATVMESAREICVKAAATLRSFERFYCRKCKMFFSSGQIDRKPECLFIACPKCGDGLIPAGNVFWQKKRDAEQKEHTSESTQ